MEGSGSELHTFKLVKRRYLPHYLSDTGLNGGPLQIPTTVSWKG